MPNVQRRLRQNPMLMSRLGNLMYTRYFASAAMAVVYLNEEVIGTVPVFNSLIRVADIGEQLKRNESSPYRDTVDRLMAFARMPDKLDKDVMDSARKLNAISPTPLEQQWIMLQNLVSIMHNHRIAYLRVSVLCSNYGVPLSQPSYGTQRAKGPIVPEQRAAGHRGPDANQRIGVYGS